MRFYAAGECSCWYRTLTTRCGWKSIVNSILSVWRLELHLGARSAGTENVRPFGGQHDVTRHAGLAQVQKVPKVTSSSPHMMPGTPLAVQALFSAGRGCCFRLGILNVRNHNSFPARTRPAPHSQTAAATLSVHTKGPVLDLLETTHAERNVECNTPLSDSPWRCG